MGITYLVCVLAVLSCVVIRDCDGKPTERELSILADLIELEVENRNIAENKVGQDAEAVDDDGSKESVDGSEPGPELNGDDIKEKVNNALRDVRGYIPDQFNVIKLLLDENKINEALNKLKVLSEWIHDISDAVIRNNAVLEKNKKSVDNAAKFIQEKEAEIQEQGAILDTTLNAPSGSAGGPSGAGSSGGPSGAGSAGGPSGAGSEEESSEAGPEEGSPEAGSSEAGSSGGGPSESGSAEGPPESGSGPPEGGSAESPPESGSAEGPPESGSGPPEGGSAEGPPESGSAGGPPESGPAGGPPGPGQGGPPGPGPGGPPERVDGSKKRKLSQTQIELLRLLEEISETRD